MKIVVTGCLGFIGYHLSLSLIEIGHTVTGIDIIEDEFKLKNLNRFSNFEFYKDDIVTTNQIYEISPDIVINLAAKVGVRDSLRNQKEYIKTNILGFQNIIDQCKISNTKLLIYASSSSVYGENKKVPFSESDSLDNIISPYAMTKLANEQMAKLHYHLSGINSIGFRFFTVYGPLGRKDMMPYKVMNSLINDLEFEKYGSGETLRDYTFISDIVSGIISSIDKVGKSICEVYNLGATNPITLNKFIQTCEKVSGKIAKYKTSNIQLGDVSCTWADTSKAKIDLNWTPKIELEEGLQKLWLSLRS